MLSFKPFFAAAFLLAGGRTLAQAPSTGLVVDAPPFAPYVGTTIPLGARPASSHRAQNPTAHITWESSDPTIAWVTADGAAVLLRPGKVTLTARLGTLAGKRTLEIRESAARTLELALDREVVR